MGTKRKHSFSVPVPPQLRQELCKEFDLKYKQKGMSIGSFVLSWQYRQSLSPEKIELPPSKETLRQFFNLSRGEKFEYWLVDGCCQLLLERSFREWSEQKQTEANSDELPTQGELQISDFDSQIPPEEIQPIPTIYNNLPARECLTFIGRQEEMQKLLELLSFQHPGQLIIIDGIGGVGKTALVLEAAHRCLNASKEIADVSNIPTFEAIVFTSAQQQQLFGDSPVRRLRFQRTLEDILRKIARTIDCPIDRLDLEEQFDRIQESLQRKRTLLILDNLETIAPEEQAEIRSFLSELPPTVKAIMTTRDRTPFIPSIPISLLPLSKTESLRLIQSQAEARSAFLLPDESETLYAKTGGIPAAIGYAIGQVVAKYPLDLALTQLTHSTSPVTQFWFESSVQPLKGQPAHQLLMALSIFPKPALEETLIEVVGADAVTAAKSFARLQQLSLVKQQQERYDMLPLTRDYVLVQLKSHPDFEQKTRNRAVNWYLKFSQQYGGRDWQEWDNHYAQLELEWENLKEIIEWCISQKRYENFKQFWQYLKGYTHFCGYWEERLRWMDWLIFAAVNQEDKTTAAEAMFDKSRTLALSDRQIHWSEAIALCEQAWNLCDADNLTFKFDLAINLTVIHIHQRQFDAALSWLDRGQNLLKHSANNSSREPIYILYYQGQICLKKGHYQQAKILYSQALERAEAVGWRRGKIYIYNWLAAVAIAQNNLEEASHLLNIGLPAAEENNDKRCAAFCKRSSALLEKARGNPERCRYWVESAKQDFISLKMLREAEELDSL